MEKCSLMFTFVLTITVSFISLISGEGCLYEFISHPDMVLNCNPLNYQLQLHCAVTGPANPAFQVHWYLGYKNDHNPGLLINSLLPDYVTLSGKIISQGKDEEIKTVSSVLLTPSITLSHQNQCIWCQVELEDMSVSLSNHRHRLCLDSYTSLTLLPSCEETQVVVNMQPSCITLEDVRVVRSSGVEGESGAEIGSGNMSSVITPSSTSLPNNTSLPMSSLPEQTLTNGISTSTTIPHTTNDAVAITPFPPATTTTTTSNSTTSPQGTESLLATITICVVFVIAIILLLCVAIHLSRNRCSCCKTKKKDEVTALRIENGHSTHIPQECNNEEITPQPIAQEQVGQSSLAQNQTDTNVQEAQISRDQTPQLSSVVEDDDADYDSLVNVEIAAIEATDSTAHSQPHSKRPPPAVPPKPWKNSPKYKHHFAPLPLPSQHSARSQDKPPPQHIRTTSEIYEPTVPPPVPVRSASRDHIYHTLECSILSHTKAGSSNEEVVQSPNSSYHHGSCAASSEVFTMAAEGDVDSLAQHIRELFDDPRYVSVVVDRDLEEEEEEDDEEGGLSGRRELWRSTPSLVQTGLTSSTGSDRRSLRLPHAIAANKRGRLIYS